MIIYDIIIPFHNNYNDVTNAIESIISITKSYYTITLIDDASQNPYFVQDFLTEKFKNFPIGLIRNEKQLGFGGSINKGVKNTINDYKVIIHSDCKPNNSNWLDSLHQTYKETGAKLISSTVSQAGWGLEGSSIINVEKDKVLEEPIPFISIMFHKELFNKIGTIREYPLCGYEDEEFYHRMRKSNYKIAVSKGSQIYHGGGTVIKELIKNPKNKQILMNNEELFLKDIKK